MAELDFEKLHCFVDLHLHLDGAISLASARTLARMQGITIPESDEGVLAQLRVGKQCKDLTEFLQKFAFPCSLLQTKEAITFAVRNLLAELKVQGVMYAELRFAPQKCTDGGLSQEEVVVAAIDGLHNASIPAQLILCCMRGEDNEAENEETIAVAKKFLGKGVCAVDLAGAEKPFPTKNYVNLFAIAKRQGVPFVIHAGEGDGAQSVRAALDMGACRIGHGVRAAEDMTVVRHLAEQKVPLEICPTSNVCTATVARVVDLPIPLFLEHGVTVTINTDDPSVEGTDIRTEYRKIRDAFGFDREQIKQFLRNGVSASFADEIQKAEMLAEIEKEFAAIS